MPICGTPTGWFGNDCCRKESNVVEQELGLGISIYFKQLKNLILVLLICTVLSLPSFYLYSVGNDISNEDAIEASALN